MKIITLIVGNSGRRCGKGEEKNLQRCLRCFTLLPSSLHHDRLSCDIFIENHNLLLGIIQEENVNRETKMIYKDVFVVSLSFLLLFLAFNSTFQLQSSIHTEANIGLWSKVSFFRCYLKFKNLFLDAI